MSNKNSTTIEGRIIHLGQVEQKSEKFRMRIIVIETADKYPQQIPVQFTNANVDKAESLKLGDVVTISCNIRGREYSGKWYISLDAWRIEATAQSTPVTPLPAIGQNVSKALPPIVDNLSEDLPF